MEELPDQLTVVATSAGIFLLLGGVIFLSHLALTRLFANHPGRQHYRQVVFGSFALFLLVLAVVLLPVSDQLQGQLLASLGLLIGAAIALSSAKPLGNMLAGISFRAASHCGVGDHVEVGAYSGYIARMDLLGMEIRTVQHDTVNVSNLYLLANPLRVLNAADDLLRFDLSLAYDVPRKHAEMLLQQAAKAVNLQQAVVEIGELGDTDVTYRLCGRAHDINALTAVELDLKARVLDGLQAMGVARRAPVQAPVAAAPTLVSEAAAVQAGEPKVEQVPAIDAADRKKRTGELNELKKEYTEMSQRLIEVEQELRQADQGEARKPLSLEKKKLEARLLRVEKEIARVEATLNAA